MTVTGPMESYAARLASFNATHPATKKRASDPKGKRTLKWPHQRPTPPQLARAGFFYRPTSSSPDNTTCYLCGSNLDGWEEDDDAVVEHLKHAPECGWAVTIAIEQDIERGSYSLEDPMSERIMNARRMTFGTSWPHENKKGWSCKTKKMVEAGWHYCPTLESEDFVKCSYCQLSLDGWEPKDKPFDEHQRRSPDCSFFTLYASIKSKFDRPKKARVSKASRMSTQSNVTAAPEGISIAETDANVDETMMSTAESVKPTKTTKGGKKAPKAKRMASKAKGKAAKTKEEEPQIASSYLEPEDDDFEVKIATSPVAVASGKKRRSEEISVTRSSPDRPEIAQKEVDSVLPPAKRRNTRARASVQASETPVFGPSGEDIVDSHMTDVEEIPAPSAPASRKNGKESKKRASSTTRKASTASTASKASLRAAVPKDEDIEAALEADLDRPLTDDEAPAQLIETQQPKGRRLTRTKPGSRKATASVAPTRRGTRASSVQVDEPSLTTIYPSIQTATLEDSEPTVGNVGESKQDGESAKPSPRVKNPKAKASRKASVQQQDDEKPVKGSVENLDESVAAANKGSSLMGSLATKSQQSKSRQVSRQLPTRKTRASNAPNNHDAVDPTSDVNSSILNTQTLHDDSGHETDAGGLKPNRTKRPGKKAPGTRKKAKGEKKAAVASRNTPDVLQAPLDEIQHEEIYDTSIAVPNNADIAGIEAAEDQGKATKPPKQSESVEEAPNIKDASQGAPVVSSPERPPTVIEVQDTPASPTPSSVNMTPRPALSTQSSDAENQPPSSRPSTLRPPLSIRSPSKSQMTRIPLTATTPVPSPSKGNFSRLQSTFPWTAIDLGQIFNGTPNDDKENDPFVSKNFAASVSDELTSSEQKLTVEQWIQFNAQRGEDKLRNQCERVVGRFEEEGVRALKTLEGIICTQ